MLATPNARIQRIGPIPGLLTLMRGRPHTEELRRPRYARGVTADQVAEVLVAARAELADPRRWLQGALAEVPGYLPLADPNDLYMFPRVAVTRLCAYGAIVFSAFWQQRPFAVVEAAEDALRFVIGGREVHVWNDHECTDHAEVYGAFGRAIALVVRGEM